MIDKIEDFILQNHRNSNFELEYTNFLKSLRIPPVEDAILGDEEITRITNDILLGVPTDISYITNQCGDFSEEEIQEVEYPNELVYSLALDARNITDDEYLEWYKDSELSKYLADYPTKVELIRDLGPSVNELSDGLDESTLEKLVSNITKKSHPLAYYQLDRDFGIKSGLKRLRDSFRKALTANRNNYSALMDMSDTLDSASKLATLNTIVKTAELANDKLGTTADTVKKVISTTVKAPIVASDVVTGGAAAAYRTLKGDSHDTNMGHIQGQFSEDSNSESGTNDAIRDNLADYKAEPIKVSNRQSRSETGDIPMGEGQDSKAQGGSGDYSASYDRYTIYANNHNHATVPHPASKLYQDDDGDLLVRDIDLLKAQSKLQRAQKINSVVTKITDSINDTHERLLPYAKSVGFSDTDSQLAELETANKQLNDVLDNTQSTLDSNIDNSNKKLEEMSDNVEKYVSTKFEGEQLNSKDASKWESWNEGDTVNEKTAKRLIKDHEKSLKNPNSSRYKDFKDINVVKDKDSNTYKVIKKKKTFIDGINDNAADLMKTGIQVAGAIAAAKVAKNAQPQYGTPISTPAYQTMQPHPMIQQPSYYAASESEKSMASAIYAEFSDKDFALSDIIDDVARAKDSVVDSVKNLASNIKASNTNFKNSMKANKAIRESDKLFEDKKRIERFNESTKKSADELNLAESIRKSSQDNLDSLKKSIPSSQPSQAQSDPTPASTPESSSTASSSVNNGSNPTPNTSNSNTQSASSTTSSSTNNTSTQSAPSTPKEDPLKYKRGVKLTKDQVSEMTDEQAEQYAKDREADSKIQAEEKSKFDKKAKLVGYEEDGVKSKVSSLIDKGKDWLNNLDDKDKKKLKKVGGMIGGALTAAAVARIATGGRRNRYYPPAYGMRPGYYSEAESSMMGALYKEFSKSEPNFFEKHPTATAVGATALILGTAIRQAEKAREMQYPSTSDWQYVGTPQVPQYAIPQVMYESQPSSLRKDFATIKANEGDDNRTITTNKTEDSHIDNKSTSKVSDSGNSSNNIANNINITNPESAGSKLITAATNGVKYVADGLKEGTKDWSDEAKAAAMTAAVTGGIIAASRLGRDHSEDEKTTLQKVDEIGGKMIDAFTKEVSKAKVKDKIGNAVSKVTTLVNKTAGEANNQELGVIKPQYTNESTRQSLV